MSTGNSLMLEDFRLPEMIGDRVTTVCLVCKSIFMMPELQFWATELKYPRQAFPLCRRCYSHLYFRTSTEGLDKINELIRKDIPKAYHSAEFNTLQCGGAYGAHLGGVRQRVIRWAQDIVGGQKRSLFLFSKPGARGTGCGNGKTHLMWAAYRYIARNTACYRSDTADTPYYPCRFLDLEGMVGDFKARKAKCSYDETPSYEIPCSADSFNTGTFDKYREYLAGRMLLFIDDLGKGYPKGMLVETIEYLVDQRADRGLPTFFTSNYSIDDLDKRLSPRIASRILRNGCDVVELRAPDYWRCRASETSQQERWDGAGDGTPATGERNVPAETNITLTKEAVSK